jgi:dienelactone hydrolase
MVVNGAVVLDERMSIRISLASCLVTILAGCSGASSSSIGPTSGNDSGVGVDDAGGVGVSNGDASGGRADSGSSGSPDGGSGSHDGGGGIVDGAAPDSSVGTGSDGSTAGLSKCGGPLDTIAPTAASIVNDGPLAVTSYTSGLPTSTDYQSLTVFYPSAGAGPFVVVMISPGLTEILAYLQLWAQRFASYGYVAVFVAANDTDTDSEATRAVGLWSAIASIKGENTRSGSPLEGKLSTCIVTSGHSLGGGASLTIANSYPTAVVGALGFNPYDPLTTFSSIVVPTLVITGQDDTTAPPAQHGLRQYDSMSPSISKEYVEIEGGTHQAALFPGTIPGQYAVAWIKLTVDGDARYRPFLDEVASGVSDFLTTLP